jgi:hypothetical protein
MAKSRLFLGLRTGVLCFPAHLPHTFRALSIPVRRVIYIYGQSLIKHFNFGTFPRPEEATCRNFHRPRIGGFRFGTHFRHIPSLLPPPTRRIMNFTVETKHGNAIRATGSRHWEASRENKAPLAGSHFGHGASILVYSAMGRGNLCDTSIQGNEAMYIFFFFILIYFTLFHFFPTAAYHVKLF